ncbi:MAG: HIT family protein [Burkholderiales bacterium]|nr:HIT family protein [Burkholderiales bacterium]
MGRLDNSCIPGCELCEHDGGVLIVRTPRLRVIRVEDADYPGFYRVIWNEHKAEFTTLSAGERAHLMDVVATVESLVIQHLRPIKVNLASLGNVVPHLHWHVIARFVDDRHFPQPIWGTAQREIAKERWDVLRSRLPDLDADISSTLG